MGDCCRPDLERGFDERIAERDLRAYRRHGLSGDQRALLGALVDHGVRDQTILDVGAGVGAIHHDLLRAGARSITDVDGSSAYLAVARSEAERQGDADRITYHHGDIVDLGDTVEPADIVILVRVLCCYPDMPAIVSASTARARRVYGLVYPRSPWWMRAAAAAYRRFLSDPTVGPGYVHREEAIDAAVRGEGLVPVAEDATWFWRIALYERPGGA